MVVNGQRTATERPTLAEHSLDGYQPLYLSNWVPEAPGHSGTPYTGCQIAHSKGWILS